MAVPLVIAMLPLGLLFLLSGLIVNTVQVSLPPAARSTRHFAPFSGGFLWSDLI
jgi:lysophosphatidic acid acyltransferase/lysophosphatidylinositol acyltransferase